METLVLMPTEFGLAPTQRPGNVTQAEDSAQCLAVHSEQFISKGTRFLPFQGTVRLGRFHLEPFLPEQDVRYKFGSFDMIQELDNNRRIRQCNWVRFLMGTESDVQNYSTTATSNLCNEQQAREDNSKHTESMEPNMTAMSVDGQPVFEATKAILPHTLIMVQFKDTTISTPSDELLLYSIPGSQKYLTPSTTALQDSPLDLSKSLMGSSKAPLLVASVDGSNNRVRISQRSLLPCEVCGKVFDRPSLLKRHMRTHTGEKPHICEVCNKGFSTSSSLNTHRRIHSGDKPHQCLVCGKRFTASSNLYYHRMTHTKEKPHKCSQCSKSFPTPGDLKAHMYIHSGSWPFRCTVCSRGFSKQTNLRNHLFLHTGDRPYPCKFCGKKFALACNLRAHTKTHHHSDGKVTTNKEIATEQTGINTAKYNNTVSDHEEKHNLTSSTEMNDIKCKTYTWPEKNDKETQPILVKTSTKCTLPTQKMIQQFPSCTLLKNFHSTDNTESVLNIPSMNFTDNKTLFHMNSNTCVYDKSLTNSNQFNGISRLGYSNILEELWPGNSSFMSQCNIPLSVLPTPFNINMPCLTSISLVDVQALLMMQAANMAMLHGGNITFKDGKSLKKQMTEPAQNRSLLLA